MRLKDEFSSGETGSSGGDSFLYVVILKEKAGYGGEWCRSHVVT